eukprot:CAMPEP_0169477166 /NCGR_PEP_ID=MMETSP1042-20121227/27769_1 /TAXON_ID=464988 /ORGANISM="Hemiselmis andersenii, Strain CCMP1180" /LENGTH=63 /DNA_ID=CAMNT_0009591493 /DNA_START=191 /DNA_END=382 /DNA_ORIENTATION=+
MPHFSWRRASEEYMKRVKQASCLQERGLHTAYALLSESVSPSCSGGYVPIGKVIACNSQEGEG